ncbi:MAG: hypothetical protein Q9160_000300 [Pyrenula sp. 1 TL-2023]
MNVDSLRRKRIKRLGIKFASHSGQRRIFFIFDRAIRKFPGDIGLWMQYLDYSRKQKALKKASQILTSASRMHPTSQELWIYAASFALDENADMTEARSCMQRGLRFCRSSKKLWLEYFRLELLYVAKISARRKILGLDQRQNEHAEQPNTEMGADMVALPRITSEDIAPQPEKEEGLNEEALQKLDATPVLSGAIPVAIFDAAISQFPSDDKLGKHFYDVASSFDQLSCLRKILARILDLLLSKFPWSASTQICYVKDAISGLSVTSPKFPKALGSCFKRIKLFQADATPSERNKAFKSEVVQCLSNIRTEDALDPALDRAIGAQLKSLEKVPTV